MRPWIRSRRLEEWPALRRRVSNVNRGRKMNVNGSCSVRSALESRIAREALVIEIKGVELHVSPTIRASQFELLIGQQLDRSYRLAWLLLRNDADAEDATHEALLAAWRHWPQLREPASIDAWFGRILVNACRDELRRRTRRPTFELRSEPSVGGEHVMRGIEQRQDLWHALDALNTDQRIAVVLRYWLDLPIDAIATRMNCPPGTVKSRLHHAMRQMRAVLDAAEVAK